MASDTRPLPYMCTKESNRKRIDAFNRECVANGLEPDWYSGWGYVGVDGQGRHVIRLSWPELKAMSVAEIHEHVKLYAVMWPFL